jgi:hypothetical protein
MRASTALGVSYRSLDWTPRLRIHRRRVDYSSFKNFRVDDHSAKIFDIFDACLILSALSFCEIALLCSSRRHQLISSRDTLIPQLLHRQTIALSSDKQESRLREQFRQTLRVVREQRSQAEAQHEQA